MYTINEGTIDLPDEWKDQSINVVSANGGGAGMTFTITRDQIPWGMDFFEYVEGELKQAGEALTKFTVLTKKSLTICGVDAVEIECTWKAKQGDMNQIITTVNAPTGAMVLTASQQGPLSDKQKAEVRRITSSLNFKPQEDVA
ncbi:hypothetical protein SAMN04488515_2930 [Cognatiyoonia koreensis]|uniref:DUF1795 domain-containing protein n=1 Tax=Cognatiyoonia koreensis TaxID=364200 RepID=A0A1I0RME4_9RHOB|nr:DUF1795 domain-containing protein [Cognatiyoonia koreensis]SEW42165.1 hypothetical protein SAMN04488515_2930 [Cognatiyoonia koreensis]